MAEIEGQNGRDDKRRHCCNPSPGASSLNVLEVSRHLGGRLVASLARLLQCLGDGALKLSRRMRREPMRRRRVLCLKNTKSRSVGFPTEGWLTCGHLIEHRTEAEEIRACVKLLSTRLLRRHV